MDCETVHTELTPSQSAKLKLRVIKSLVAIVIDKKYLINMIRDKKGKELSPCIIQMSLPQKKRGFRKIVIDEKVFNWRFNTLLEVCPATCKDNKVIVDFGWFDPWLYVNDQSGIPPEYDPKVVTPSFVRKVVEFALIQNWDITARAGVTKVIYRDNKFNIVLHLRLGYKLSTK